MSDIRNKIYIVFQDQVIFPGTVEDNIQMGSGVNQKKYEKILHENFMKDLIEQLPNGLLTKITEAGDNLSGGQKQKISIARLLLHNPELIILDEATSSMDEKSEEMVYDSISKYFSNTMSLIISHRNTIENYCSRIIHLEK